MNTQQKSHESTHRANGCELGASHCSRCLALEREIARLRENLDWQNMPNRREPVRGGYEFYINEEWTCIRDAALNENVGFQATLMKVRYDPDDERVRVRRVLDDDAILEELATLKSSANHSYTITLPMPGEALRPNGRVCQCEDAPCCGHYEL